MGGDDAGNVWFAFSSQLVEWNGSEYKRLSFTGHNVSPSTLFVRGGHVWLGGEGGIQLYANDTFHIMQWKDQNLPGRVSGVVETETGDLWINGFSGIVHVSSSELEKWLRDPNYAVSAECLNALDGLSGLSTERFPEPTVIEGDDGRLWFATTRGIAWLSPASLSRTYNRLPPPVMISAITSGGKTYFRVKDLVLPARTESLEIDYTALSLAIPDRVRFRYKLEGVDSEWQEVGTRRQAFYTKLRPGQYKFHAIACNNDGVWNDTGAILSFKITPAWYQTRWFEVFCGLLFLLAVWVIYSLRVRQVARAISVRFDERLAERTRLARELHDTFLQTVQESKMVVDDALEVDSDESRMRKALQNLSIWLGQAVDEGRAALCAPSAYRPQRGTTCRRPCSEQPRTISCLLR